MVTEIHARARVWLELWAHLAPNSCRLEPVGSAWLNRHRARSLSTPSTTGDSKSTMKVLRSSLHMPPATSSQKASKDKSKVFVSHTPLSHIPFWLTLSRGVDAREQRKVAKHRGLSDSAWRAPGWLSDEAWHAPCKRKQHQDTMNLPSCDLQALVSKKLRKIPVSMALVNASATSLPVAIHARWVLRAD